MKPTILHGENVVASRNKLNTLIQELFSKGYETIKLDKPTKEELLLTLRSDSLFSENRLVIAENFFSTGKDAIEILDSIRALFVSSSHASLACWEPKTLPPGTVKKLAPTFLLQEFKLPTSLFTLLDNLRPNNTANILKLYSQSSKKIEAELLFAMLIRQTRLLLWLKLDPETANLPSWQKGKLESQADKFTEKELIGLNEKLLEIDRAYKTSKLPADLTSSLNLLFTSM